ncbi:MAG: hypothetical protein ACQESP_11515 [Candidatus Muiribacteriota bacterium]
MQLTRQDYQFYKKLLETKSIIYSKIPNQIKRSNDFIQLIKNNILEKNKSGNGFKITIKDVDYYKRFYYENFPEHTESNSRKSNIKTYRDSKITHMADCPVVLLRGFNKYNLNGEVIDLAYFTKKFKLFSIANPKIEAKKICFVENKSSFLKAENLFKDDTLFIHSYGRIGSEVLKNIKANEVIVFSDYDFTGLNEYLNIKEQLKNAQFYIPENFEELFYKYSSSYMKKNKHIEPRMSAKVKESSLAEVIKVREIVLKTDRYLEQEILVG